MSGFVAIHRSAFDHPLLKDGERFRAWFWMVARAAWKPTRFDIHGKLVTIERGQFSSSIREMADAWGWSKSAVDRFLSRLKSETMIETDSGTGRLIITIRNYDRYQSTEDEGGTAGGTVSGTRAGHERDIKEEFNKGTIEEEPSGSSLAHAPKRETKRLVRLPSDWKPVLTPAAQRVVDGWPPGKLERELARFRDHAADKGRTSKDWQAAFRTWVNKADEWMNRNGSGKHPPGDNRTADQRAIDRRFGTRANGEPAGTVG